MKLRLTESKFRYMIAEMVKQVLLEASEYNNIRKRLKNYLEKKYPDFVRNTIPRFYKNLIENEITGVFKFDKDNKRIIPPESFANGGIENGEYLWRDEKGQLKIVRVQKTADTPDYTKNYTIGVVGLTDRFISQMFNEAGMNVNTPIYTDDKGQAYYEYGITRMYIDEAVRNNSINGATETNNQVSAIKVYLQNNPHYCHTLAQNAGMDIYTYKDNIFDNNLSLNELYEQLQSDLKKFRSARREKFKELGVDNKRPDYTIYRLENTEHAQNFQLKDGRTIDLSEYTTWCITSSQDNYDAYAGQFGIFYVCLQDGFEQVPEEDGDNCPLDEYGLSMIAICVTPEGDLKNVTCRWNHANGGNDTIMNDEQLAELFNADPYALFPPRSQEELRDMGYYLFDDVIEDVKRGDYSRLKLVSAFNNGGVYRGNNDNYVIVINNQVCHTRWFNWVGDFNDDGIAEVELNGEYNWFSLKKQDYLFPNLWFDWVDNFNDEGIAKVKLNDKWNFFSLEKQDYLFPNQGFDRVSDFNDEGIAKVKLNGKFNFISLKKQDYLFPNQWFDLVYDFNDDGIAKVKLNGKWNWLSLKKPGVLWPNQWFDWVDYFNDDGIAEVQLNKKYNFFSLNKPGVLLPPNQGFDLIGDFNDNGIAKVKLNDKYNWFSLEKQDYLLPNLWFDWVGDFNNEGIAIVELNGKVNFISLKKQVVLFPNQWFDWFGDFNNEGIAIVELNGKWNWLSLKKPGILLPNQWFDWVDNFNYEGIAKVKLNDKYNWFSLEKQDYLLPNLWFDWVGDFNNEGIAIVELNGKRNFFSSKKQDYLFPNQWFDMVYDFNYEGIAKVKLNGKVNFISLKKPGVLLSPNQWFDRVDYFNDKGIAIVELNGKWNWLSLKKPGILLPNQWFDWVDNFNYEGIAKVKLNDKYNWFSLEKQDYLLPNLWFDWVDDFYFDDITKVELNGKKYYFTLDGQLLDYYTRQPLSDEELQQLSSQRQIDEMVNRLVRDYRRY